MNSHHNPLLFIVVSALLLSSPFKVTDLLAAPSQNGLGSGIMVQPGSRVFSIHGIDKNGSLSREEYRHFVEQIEIRHRATGRPMRRYPQPVPGEFLITPDRRLVQQREV